MRRAPLALLAVALMMVLAAVGCGDSDDSSPTSTEAQSPATDEAARRLTVCAPLLALTGIFTDLEDVATGSAEGQVAANATLETALNQIEEAAIDPSAEVTDAIEVLRNVSFSGAEAPSGPSTEDTDAALTTLTSELGEPCGDLGG